MKLLIVFLLSSSAAQAQADSLWRWLEAPSGSVLYEIRTIPRKDGKTKEKWTTNMVRVKMDFENYGETMSLRWQVPGQDSTIIFKKGGKQYLRDGNQLVESDRRFDFAFEKLIVVEQFQGVEYHCEIHKADKAKFLGYECFYSHDFRNSLGFRASYCYYGAPLKISCSGGENTSLRITALSATIDPVAVDRIDELPAKSSKK